MKSQFETGGSGSRPRLVAPWAPPRSGDCIFSCSSSSSSTRLSCTRLYPFASFMSQAREASRDMSEGLVGVKSGLSKIGDQSRPADATRIPKVDQKLGTLTIHTYGLLYKSQFDFEIFQSDATSSMLQCDYRGSSALASTIAPS